MPDTKVMVGLTGVTLTELSSAGPMVKVVKPLTLPEVAVMLAVPGA